MSLVHKTVVEAVETVVKNSQVKPRKFIETVELQVGLKNYDPKKDPRFNVPLILPCMPKANVKIICLADAADCGRCEKENVEFLAFEALGTQFNKDAKMIKRYFKRYDVVLVSKSQVRNITKVLGPSLTKINRQPFPLNPEDSLTNKVNEIKRTVKVQFKKVLGLNWAVGLVNSSSEDVTRNIMLTINTLVEQLKKGWQNIKTIHICSTMGTSVRIF
ncbi:Ribosomal protein L10a [Spironucleus salmonicida]|uniref:Ribosomal protein L10a n=1 Tax=Spironucleus salmonicida TaxID=348837 RepID=V6LY04_9EUKA|nr:Ribosomal protein L10a [Spironucleus salmonicida]|eukprot:EST49532.1 Ribosomal protein L10a [Spironucleus salmonicida]